MAGILTHIAMAHIEKPDSDMFALGSFLPDIGYLGVIPRREIHLDPEKGDTPAERARVLRCLDENASASIKDGFIFHSLTEHS